MFSVKSITKNLFALASYLLCLLVYLCVTLLLTLPNIISADLVRKQVNDAISGKSTQVSFKKVKVIYNPFPGIKLYGLSLEIPPKFNLDLNSLSIYPDIISLFKGDLKISRTIVQGPSANLKLSKPANLRLQTIKHKLQTQYKSLIYGLALEIRDGSVNLYKNGSLLQTVSKINLKSRISKQISYKLTCDSSAWKNLQLKGKGKLKGLGFEQDLTVNQFKPHKFAPALIPCSIKPNPGNSIINLKANLTNNGFKDLDCEISVKAPFITLHRNNNTERIQDLDLRANLSRKGHKYDLDLQKLRIRNPGLSLNASMRYNSNTEDTSLYLNGENLELAEIRESCLNLLQDLKGIEPTFNVLKSGDISGLKLECKGTSFKEALADPLVNADLTRGNIYIPNIEMDLSQVQGEIKIEDQILQASDLKAKFGSSEATDGIFDLGLNQELHPFILNIDFNGDMADLPPILRKTVSKTPVLNTLNKFSGIKGQALGNLALRLHKGEVDLKLLAESFDITAGYKPNSMQGHLAGSNFYFSPGEKIQAENMDLDFGKSELRDIYTSVSMAEQPQEFSTKTQKGSLELSELSALLKDLSVSAKKYLKQIKGPKGNLELQNSNLRGNIRDPSNWEYSLKGKLHDFKGIYKDWHSPVSVDECSIDLNSTNMELRDCRADMMGSTARFTGKFKDYARDWSQGEINLKGNFVPEFITKVWKYTAFPEKFRPRTALNVKNSSIKWNGKKKTSAQADLKFANQTQLDFRLVKTANRTNFQKINLRDSHSKFKAKLDMDKNTVTSEFKGKLSNRTTYNLFGKNDIFNGEISGDFKTSFHIYPPKITNASGKLKMQNFRSEYLDKLEIVNLDIETPQGNLKILPSRFYWQDTLIEADGEISLNEDFNHLDMDFFTENMTWQYVQRLIARNEGSSNRTSWEKPFHANLKGDISLSSNRFVYKDFVFSPFKSTISLEEKEQVNVVVSKTRICSLPVNGSIQISDGQTRTHFSFGKQNLDIENCIKCFRSRDKKRLISGKMDMEGQISTNSSRKKNSDGNGIQGDIKLHAYNGKIYQVSVIAKILDFLNTTEILFGNVPDMQTQGLAYNSIDILGSLKNNKLKITKGILDGKTVEMSFKGDVDLKNKELDLIFLVAPFKTLDRLIKLVPLLSSITQGNLISVPIQVIGTASEPIIIPLSPKAIGSEALNIMQNTLKFPITIIQPFIPDEEAQTPEGQ